MEEQPPPPWWRLRRHRPRHNRHRRTSHGWAFHGSRTSPPVGGLVSLPRGRPKPGRQPWWSRARRASARYLWLALRAAASVEQRPRGRSAGLRGGAFTYKTSGVAFDCWRAKAAIGEPEAFATLWGFGKTAGFHTNGEVADGMAKAWVHNVSYSFDAWVAAGRPGDMSWAAHVSSYEEACGDLRLGRHGFCRHLPRDSARCVSRHDCGGGSSPSRSACTLARRVASTSFLGRGDGSNDFPRCFLASRFTSKTPTAIHDACFAPNWWEGG